MTVLLISAAVIVIDLISKSWIQNDTTMHSIKLIPGFFHITYAENTGMAWSMLSGHTMILAAVSFAAIVGMVWYLRTHQCSKFTKIALALMIGGAAGNLYDRAFLGYVRDFLDFYIFGYDFPIFNIADSALCIGVFILFLTTMAEEKKNG